MKKYLEKRDTENTFNEVMNLEKISVKQKQNNSDYGIYFLWLNDVIVYIGMSDVSINDRIFGGGFGGHIHDKNKIFNHYSYFNLSNEDDIKLHESFLINLFNPYFNIQLKNFFYDHNLNKNYKLKREKINNKIGDYYFEKNMINW